ncbi:hypothetical protein [Olleya sp. YS]|uniref:hypothetical protein n=1 Tax=Olleya sp. YS TaxID=3028318 RepID=UPI002434249C|nr:hypothetical protein [Olleya sp. YS]WGD33892.1 hypothetical protein Ollyesu_08885 [Olleya sp. YS]
MEKLNEKQLLVAREEFRPFLTMKNKGLSKLKLKTSLNFFKQQFNTTYESLGCVGYNPTFKQLTATINIKRATGYSGGLCTNGSFEYVRFYMDYQDGNGWEDMGYVGVNVHDIPTEKDCSNTNEKPINYTVRLNINPKKKFCSTPNLPIVRAVLSWNSVPEPNDPDLTAGTYVWSDKKDVQVQIEPLKFFIPDFPLVQLDDLFNTAILNPSVSFDKLVNINPNLKNALQDAKQAVVPKAYNFAELNALYKKENIGPERFGHKLLKQVQSSNQLANLTDINDLFELNSLNLPEILVNWNNLNCNTNYEELLCVGADYNQEALVGTLKIKKPSGYSGNLCSTGSKEYVSFWIQTEDNCQWKHAGTTFVNAYDIASIPSDGIHYSVVLPYSFEGLKQDCENPQVLKVRAILSWNTPPQGMNCSNYGNVIESYVQLKPQSSTANGPKLVSVGGVSTDFINTSSGLTLGGSKFGFNMHDVTADSAFAGTIVIQGLTNTYKGQKYKIKATNLDTGDTKYINNDFVVEGYDEVAGMTTYDTSSAPGDEYTYIGDKKNTYNVIARFELSGNNKWLIELEHLGAIVDSQVIQMDNQSPILTLDIDNYGNCSHFKKGVIITGTYKVEEVHLSHFTLSTTATDVNQVLKSSLAGDSTNGSFMFTASTSKNCGNIRLSAKPKTVVNSVEMHKGVAIAPNICLSDN